MKSRLISLFALIGFVAGLVPFQAAAQSASAPVITTQPASFIVTAGATVSFNVVATGTPAPVYRWFKNGRAIEDATTPTLVLASVQTNDAAVYTVRVSNSAGAVTSTPAALTVNAVAGTITTAPASQNVDAGSNVTFTVNAAGPGLTYQWRYRDRPIAGATSATLTLSHVGAVSDGVYSVVISNSSGTAAASAAVLTLRFDARLSNISTRAHIGDDDEALITGFAIRGDARKRVVLRAVGPTLAKFGVTQALAHPTLTLYHGSTLIGTNSHWGGGADLAQAFAQVGAFALPPDSDDAALLPTLAVGNYSALITAPSGADGIALAELYDADPGSPATEFVNISTRAAVGAEAADTLIAGFAISGTTSETVLVRGVGPSLGTLFGLRRALGASHVAVYDAKGNLIDANTVWNTHDHGRPDAREDEDSAKESDVDDASDRCGAFHLPHGSTDSALLLTLAPGTYTAHVTGVGRSSGIALVEIYEVR